MAPLRHRIVLLLRGVPKQRTHAVPPMAREGPDPACGVRGRWRQGRHVSPYAAAGSGKRQAQGGIAIAVNIAPRMPPRLERVAGGIGTAGKVAQRGAKQEPGGDADSNAGDGAGCQAVTWCPAAGRAISAAAETTRRA